MPMHKLHLLLQPDPKYLSDQLLQHKIHEPVRSGPVNHNLHLPVQLPMEPNPIQVSAQLHQRHLLQQNNKPCQ